MEIFREKWGIARGIFPRKSMFIYIYLLLLFIFFKWYRDSEMSRLCDSS